jgi:hypothetical protein
MKIRFDNTVEDIVALNRYLYAHSPAFRLQRVALAILVCALPAALVVPVLLASFEAEGVGDFVDLAVRVIILVIGFLIAIPWAWIVRRLFAWSINWQVHRLFREGENRGILGSHELELTATGLIERTAYNETATKLEAVERVVDAGEFTIIFLSAVSGHVIPRHAVTEGDYDHFAGAIAHRLTEIDRFNRRN